MRSRPKQVNYLAKFGVQQQKSHEAPSDSSRAAMKSADRIINNDRNQKRAPMVPTKPNGKPKGSGAVRPSGQGQQFGGGSSVLGEDAGGQIKQYINWNDIPDESSFASGQDNADAVAPAVAKFLNNNDDEDYWAQPVTNSNAVQAPASAEQSGRPPAMVDQTDHWAAPRQPQRAISPVSSRAQHHNPQQQNMQVRSSPLQQPIRRNGEYEGSSSPRGQPPQNVIPRIAGGMRPMRQEQSEHVTIDDAFNNFPSPRPVQQPHKQENHGFSPPPKQKNSPRGIQVQHDDGFSAPPKQRISPRGQQQQQQQQQDDDVGVMRKGKKPPPLPFYANSAQAQAPLSHREPDEWLDAPASGGSGSGGGRGGQGSNKTSPRYEQEYNYGQEHGYTNVPDLGYNNHYQNDDRSNNRQSQWSAEYEDDSMEIQSPSRGYGNGKQQQNGGNKKNGIPLVHAVHQKADFHNRYTGIGKDDIEARERNQNKNKPSGAKKGVPLLGGKIIDGAHVRKGAPQLVSPRSSLDSVNPFAPPLPFDRKSDGSYASKHDDKIDDKDRLHYSKAPRKVEYKPYTLDDYKGIKKNTYVEVPKLQPDLNSDVLIAKRANQARVKEFSKQLKHFNKNEIANQNRNQNQPNNSKYDAAAARLEKAAAGSKREKALEYGKKVRNHAAIAKEQASVQAHNAARGKPSKKHEYSEDDWHGEPDFSDEQYLSTADPTGQSVDKAREIEALEGAHEDSKRQIDAIKRALKL